MPEEVTFVHEYTYNVHYSQSTTKIQIQNNRTRIASCHK